jgi:hypothetical protein
VGVRALDLLRLLWLSLPVTLGPAVQDGLSGVSSPVGWVAALGLWAAWAGTLLALLVPRVLSLTVLRVAAPAAGALAVVSALRGGVDGLDLLGLAVAALVLVVATWPSVGADLVDGSSYGPERRLPLRLPPAVAFVAAPVAVAVVLVGIAAGPLLVAAERWVVGAIVCVVGGLVVLLAGRALHQLSRRFLVFVPGGLVVHDPMTVVEPVLFPRGELVSVGPAPADTEALDLTMGAGGLIIQLALQTPTTLVRRRPGRTPDQALHAASVLVAPTRPSAFLAEAEERRLPVGG